MAHRSMAWLLAATLVAVTLVVVAPAAEAQPAARDITRFACPVDLLDPPFGDVDGNTHETAIRCIATYGITQGTSDNRYSPAQFVRRGQMATFLARLMELQGVAMDVEDQGFTDIAGHPHEDSINAVASIGVARGKTPTRFAPQDLVSRAEMATFLFRVVDIFGPPLPAGPDAFGDDDGTTHEAAIDAVAAAGIAQGTGSRRFDPNGGVTRAAMAAFIARVLDRGVEENILSSFAGESLALAALTPAEVVGGGVADARGSLALSTIGMPDVVCYSFLVDGLQGHSGVVAHLHKGAAGATGGTPVLTVQGPFAPDPDFPVAEGSAARCVRVDPAVVADLEANPESYYADIHTSAASNGAVRGQLGRLDAFVVADMEGLDVVPGPGDADGFGYAELVTTTKPGDLCFYVGVAAVDTPTSAQVRRGAAGEAGQIVVTLKTPVQTVADVFETAGCIGGLDPALVAAIGDRPQDFSVSVGTGAHPAGAVRGRLRVEPAA